MTQNLSRPLIGGICTHGELDWIEFLKDLPGITIGFITCEHDFKEIYQKAFTGASVISIAECHRGLALGPEDEALSDAELQELNHHWKTLMQIFDRAEIDANHPQICHWERSHLIGKISSFYLRMVRSSDFVFFGDVPHNVYDYLLYVICRIRKISMYVLKKALPLPGYYTLSHELGSSTSNVALGNDVEIFREHVREFLLSKTGQYASAEPWYMVMQKQQKDHGSIMGYLKRPASVLKLFTPKSKIGTDAVYGISYSGALPTPQQTFLCSYLPKKTLNFYFKRRLKRTYARLCRSFSVEDLKGQHYIALYLHYQPEMTSLPIGGAFADQECIVRLLHASLPDGWKLLIKEHTAQLEGPADSLSGRWGRFYDTMNAFENVVLCDYKIDPFELIDNARFVASISGTVILEALARGKQVLLFGDIWVGRLKGVHSIKTMEDVTRALATEYPYDSTDGLVEDMLGNMGEFIQEEESRLTIRRVLDLVARHAQAVR